MFSITYIVKLAFELREFADINYVLNHYIKLHLTNTLPQQGPKVLPFAPLPPHSIILRAMDMYIALSKKG